MNLRRRIIDKVFVGLALLALGAAIIPLLSILIDVARRGIYSVNLDLFTQLPPLANTPGGGLGNAIQGTVILVALASGIGLPVGLASGIYVSEYGSRGWFGRTVRFLGDVLAGIPSIVTGVLVYILIVVTYHGFSATAGGVALGMMMVPIVSNTTAEALRAVPNSLREASSALGIRKWRTSLLILVNGKRAVATGCLLAVARISGESAPLLLTAGISTLWFSGFDQSTASLPIYIFYYATSPFKNWQNLAWAGALVLVAFVLAINAGVRVITRGKRTYV